MIHRNTTYGYVMPNNLEACIKAAGMKKKDLAAKVGIQDATLSRHINGHVPITIEQAEIYAKILGVSTQKVLFREDPIPIYGQAFIDKDGTTTRTVSTDITEYIYTKAYAEHDMCGVRWSVHPEFTGVWYEWDNAVQFLLRSPIDTNTVHQGCIQNVSCVKIETPVSINPQYPAADIYGGVLYPEPGNRYTIHNPKHDVLLQNQKVVWATPMVSVIYRPDLRGCEFIKAESLKK